MKIVSPSITNLDGTIYAVEDQYGYTNRAYSTEADSTNAGILTMRVDAIRQYTNTATGAVTVLSRQSSYYDGFGFLRVDETYNESNGWTRSQYHPDDQGRAIYAIDPLGNTQTASYDAWGQQIEATDPYGNLYITANHMTQRKNNHFAIAAADVSAYRANADNRSIRLNAVEQSYDVYGNLATTTAFKDGASQNQPIQESYTYDLQGNILSYTDPNQTQNSNGVTSNYTYDALNRLTAVQDGIDQTTRYAYDGTGGLTKITVNAPAGTSETLYTKAYNEAGQLTDKTDTSGKNTANSYSSRGLVEEMRDRNGTITNYQYDERGQRTVATLVATNGNTLQTKTIFGSGGNILTDRHELYLNGTKTATQTSTIDKQDRITSLTSTGTNQYSSRLDVAYDTLDRITNQKNSLSGSSFFTNYGYDKLRLSQIQTNGAQTRNTAKANNVNYEYTPLGMVQAITFPTLADGSVLKESFTYDALNRLSQMNNTKGSSTLSAYSYTYDNNGNILTVSESLNGGEAKTSTYTYDKLNRLATVKRIDGSTASYTYDLRGNRKTLSDTQEASATKESSYSYDLDNKLIAATIDGTKTTIDYLPDGLRSQKTTGTSTTQYGYNGSGQVVSEKGSNGNTSTYIRGDRVLVKKDQTASKDYYYLFNGHGDVVQMVDTSGTIVNSYGYDEWGNIAKQQETVANNFKYAGEAYDSETGLYYLKSRYYDPSQGRFLNEDSYEGKITNPLSLNNYTYVENSPLMYIDPLGFAASYVFYTTNPDSNFKAQADFQKERLEKNGDTVNMMESNTIAKFEDGWNNIGVVDGKQVEVNEVVIISHTRENVIIFQDGTSTNAMSISGKNSAGQKIGNFSQLESKKMTSLTFLTCNAGHLAAFSTGNDNLASYFLKNKVDGSIVYAYDGNVVFGSKWTRWATNDLTSRLSSEQDTPYSILKKYHQKARKPYGKVSYHIDENGKVLAGF